MWVLLKVKIKEKVSAYFIYSNPSTKEQEYNNVQVSKFWDTFRKHAELMHTVKGLIRVSLLDPTQHL